FQIKHIFHHNAGRRHQVHRRLDITEEFIAQHALRSTEVAVNPFAVALPLAAKPHSIRRLAERDPDFMESYLSYALKAGSAGVSGIHLAWNDEEILTPNVSDRNTVLNMAIMALDAYCEVPEDSDWKDVGKPWNYTGDSFGWQDDGVRGHVFVSGDNSSVVISLKGTNAALFAFGARAHDESFAVRDGSSETVTNDKLNDNLLFSCCCARVSYLWTTVCDCYKSSYTCDQECLEKEMVREDRYYRSVLDIYRNVTNMYPHAQNIWVTGHSLGGALASLLGRTYGLPVVAFQAPGELLATRRLHLPMAPGLPTYMEHIWHFGHTADPIYLGVCNGASLSCSVAGYAMETQCHTGLQCVYDVVTDLGWHLNVMNHRIHTVIDEVINVYNATPQCFVPPPCRDCFNWKFVTHTTLASTTSSVCVPSATLEPRKCLKRTWYGLCYKWDD
ncbi:hypothetical protein BABINDRAFT_19159, partial [Babjeviella inositovora NRRL Y-12698]